MKARRAELKTLSDVIGDESDARNYTAEAPDRLVARSGQYWEATRE